MLYRNNMHENLRNFLKFHWISFLGNVFPNNCSALSQSESINFFMYIIME